MCGQLIPFLLSVMCVPINHMMCCCLTCNLYELQQYQDSIKLYKAGKPVNFDELPTPPGIFIQFFLPWIYNSNIYFSDFLFLVALRFLLQKFLEIMKTFFFSSLFKLEFRLLKYYFTVICLLINLVLGAKNSHLV